MLVFFVSKHIEIKKPSNAWLNDLEVGIYFAKIFIPFG